MGIRLKRSGKGGVRAPAGTQPAATEHSMKKRTVFETIPFVSQSTFSADFIAIKNFLRLHGSIIHKA